MNAAVEWLERDYDRTLKLRITEQRIGDLSVTRFGAAYTPWAVGGGPDAIRLMFEPLPLHNRFCSCLEERWGGYS